MLLFRRCLWRIWLRFHRLLAKPRLWRARFLVRFESEENKGRHMRRENQPWSQGFASSVSLGGPPSFQVIAEKDGSIRDRQPVSTASIRSSTAPECGRSLGRPEAVGVKNFADFGRHASLGEGLLKKSERFVQTMVADQCIIGVARHVKYLDAGAQCANALRNLAAAGSGKDHVRQE